MQSLLEDMDFRAGVSRPFNDLFHATTYFRQAMHALDLGPSVTPGCRYSLFDDLVLDYMLANCCGEYDIKQIAPPELSALYHCGPTGPEYVATLREFLDSGCHTTQTAQSMYLHRSTLIKRLDRIREFVDLESPEHRLYLQICLRLPGIDQVLASK